MKSLGASGALHRSERRLWGGSMHYETKAAMKFVGLAGLLYTMIMVPALHFGVHHWHWLTALGVCALPFFIALVLIWLCGE
jgi:hypothetical protein